MKREIRDIQSQQDDMEISNLKLKQDLKGSEGDFNSQLNLMACRIQDLTNKLTSSEKQVSSSTFIDIFTENCQYDNACNE